MKIIPFRLFVWAMALHILWPVPMSASAFDTSRTDISAFIDTMVNRHQMDRELVTRSLTQAESKESILEAIQRPAEKSKPWYEYRKIFINKSRIDAGIKFWQQHAAEIGAVARETGVPAEIIVAILGVETHYGKITGSYRVIDALATLAFDYPPRSPFFTRELEHFFLLASEEGVDLLGAKGSYAGAMGAPQFMPSSYRTYSADGDADGARDLFANWHDVFSSIAHYFVGHGWQAEGPLVSPVTIDESLATRLELKKILPTYRVGFLRGQGIVLDGTASDEELAMIITLDDENALRTWVGFQNFYVITRYNRSKMYAMSVVELGAALKERIGNGK